MSDIYPASDVGFISGFYVRHRHPFKAVHQPDNVHATSWHNWQVVDCKGMPVFAWMMTMSAAYQAEEALNMRAAKEIMTND